MKRLNITIPEEINQEIKDIPNKSAFISIAIKEKLERMKKLELDKLLIEGYQVASEEDKELSNEWEDITLEGWQ